MSWVQSDAKKVPTLKPTELFEKRKNRDSSRLRAYNIILEQIHARILTASRQTAETFLLYTVPPFILGLPRLDLEDCIVYVVYQLRQQGYEVRYTYPNLLFISWAHHEKEYLTKQSPITQAMTPLHVEKKQQTTRVRFQEETVQKSALKTRAQPTGAIRMMDLTPSMGYGAPAPPRDINSYKPPTSFLDAVERPSPTIPTKKDVLGDLWNF